MSIFRVWYGVAALVVFSALQVYARADAHALAVQERVNRVRSLYKHDGKLGLAIYSVSKDSELVAINADSLFRPASTIKIVATAAALETLGRSYQPATALALKGALRATRFTGVMSVIGGGDPNISGRYFGTPLKAFKPWIDSLRALKIDTIQGSLIFDHSWFPDPFRPVTWKDDFFRSSFGAEVSALSFNDNCITIEVSPAALKGQPPVVIQDPNIRYLEVITLAQTVAGTKKEITYSLDEKKNRVTISGSIGTAAESWSQLVPVKNPPAFFKAALLYALKESGITVIEESVSRQEPAFVREFTFTTAPLMSILDEINQRSQNLHAEMLLRNLGGFAFGQASLANGIKAEHQFLKRLGIDSTQYALFDGSGLSYETRITPRAVTKILSSMIHGSNAELFYNSLARPGINGVSGKRLPSLAYKNRVRYKTGFVNFTQGLVGYITTSAQDTLAVALYLNDYTMHDYDAQLMMDSLWCEITNFYNQEQESLLKARKLWYQVKDTAYSARLEAFSALLKGNPYLLGPTGEGVFGDVETKPLINMFQFDCVTFIESVMALARASSPDAILDELLKIRYKKGRVYYSMRKHYFIEDWIRSSPELVKEIKLQGDTSGVRVMDKKKFYAAKKWEYKFDNPKTKLNYLPLDTAVKLFSKPGITKEQIVGVGFVGKFPNIWVTHTGFLIRKPGAVPILRHASFTDKKVEDVPFAEYLKGRAGTIIGVMLFEFIPPGRTK